MKSSSGSYYIGLDHIRAVAAFMVFTWHFTHYGYGQSAPLPIFPLSLLTEGHTGVALFMTLSGYLFAKLLEGKQINYTSFVWNRILRLIPLLTTVIFLIGIQKYLSGESIYTYIKTTLQGTISPLLPAGGWSITVEFHYYLLLPIILILARKWKYALLIALLTAILTRYFLYRYIGEIQTLSYFTIVGRIDQFLLGTIAYQFRSIITQRQYFVAFSSILFAIFYRHFDQNGGFYRNPTYPSPNAIWIFIPTIEGFAYALVIAWYDNSIIHSAGFLSRFIALIGNYSYSIYLLHVFFADRLFRIINNHIIPLSNIYLTMLFSTLCFLFMIPIGYISYRFIESPFLVLRKRYIIDKPMKP